MSSRSRGLLLSLTFGLLALVGKDIQAAMTLEFSITPLVKPMVGSLTVDKDGSLRATNLALTSVTSVNTGMVETVSKYLDFQTGGPGGSNFFVLDGPVETSQGMQPTAMTSPAASTTLAKQSDGSFLFTMKINYGYVNNALSSQFGETPNEFGWSGVLSLSIAAFNPLLAAGQITSGSLILTSLDPVPAGETLTPNVVPEPSSVILLGVGLVVVAGRFRSTRTRARS